MEIGLLDKYLLQYRNPSGNDSCDLVIGLDFGTSASKVVVQAPYEPGGRAWAIDFQRFAHSSMVHLLPTQFWVTANGKCSLSPNGEDRRVNDIKLELISREQNLYSKTGPTKQEIKPEVAAVAYLSLLLRYTREWFLSTKINIFKHFIKFNWSLNLGVPSKSMDNTEQNILFEKIGKAAWALSVLEQNTTLNQAEKELQNVDCGWWENDPDNVTCQFNIAPEIIAGAFGYKSSELRREGLHLMVDVGASTLDVCSFNLSQEKGVDLVPLLTADVEQLGTIRIHHERIQAILNKYKEHSQDQRDRHDPVSPITENYDDYILSRDELIVKAEEADKLLKSKCNEILHDVVTKLKQKKAPLDNIFYGKARLPILLVGGGSRLPFYNSMPNELNIWMQKYWNNCLGAEIISIAKPNKLECNTIEHDRLSVAWGLSHPHIDMGKFFPSNIATDIHSPQITPYDANFIDKDKV